MKKNFFGIYKAGGGLSRVNWGCLWQGGKKVARSACGMASRKTEAARKVLDHLGFGKERKITKEEQRTMGETWEGGYVSEVIQQGS